MEGGGGEREGKAKASHAHQHKHIGAHRSGTLPVLLSKLDHGAQKNLKHSLDFEE